MRDQYTILFVSGLHRSGTTALARCLAGHPEVSGLTGTGVPEDEGQHLQTVYPTGQDLGGPGHFARNERAHLTEESPLATRENADRLWAAWSPYWQTDRRVLLEKSPPNLVMTRFLSALFPGAAHVVITRNPVVVALSTWKWAETTPLADLVENWFSGYDVLRADLPHLARVRVVAYETLVHEPAATLAGIADFLRLGTPVDHGLVQAHHSDGYERQWAAMAESEDPAVREAHHEIVERFATRAAGYGYDLTDLAAADPAAWATLSG